jgi:hypothetical protein
MITRRHFFTKTAAAAAGATVANSLMPMVRADETSNPAQIEVVKSTVNAPVDPGQQFPPGEPGQDYTPVITPNGAALPFKIVDGVKVFHLIPEPVDHEFAPGLRAHC